MSYFSVVVRGACCGGRGTVFVVALEFYLAISISHCMHRRMLSVCVCVYSRTSFIWTVWFLRMSLELSVTQECIENTIIFDSTPNHTQFLEFH